MTSTTSPSKNAGITAQNRRAHLDGLRAIAALYVLAHHCWLTVYPAMRPTGIAAPLTDWLKYGQFAVAAFVVLSGYCLTLPTLSNHRLAGGLFGYMTRRARRILPAYWIALALSALLTATILNRPTGTHWDMVLPFSGRGAFSCALLIDDLNGGRCPNHALWSVAVEWHIYLLLPLLLWMIRKFGAAVTLGAVIPLLIVIDLGLHASPWMRLSPQMYVLFALGVAACHLGSRQPRGPWVGLAAAFALLTVVGITYYGAAAVQSEYLMILDLPAGATVACLLIAIEQRPWLAAPFSWHRLTFVGGFSYSLYLLHAPLVQLSWQMFVHPAGLVGLPAFAVTLAAGGCVSAAAAWVLYATVERRWMAKQAHSRQRVDTMRAQESVLLAAAQ